MKLHSNRWNWRGNRVRGVVGDGDRVLWGLRGLHGRSQLESPKHGRFDLHRLQHLDYLIVAGQAASAAGNVAGSVRDGVASVCQVRERCARHSCFSHVCTFEFEGIQIQGLSRLHQLFMPPAKTKTVWQYLLQVTSMISNSFQDVAGAASQRLLSYKYAPTKHMPYFQRVYLKKKTVLMFGTPGTRATEIWITWLKSSQNIPRQTAR